MLNRESSYWSYMRYVLQQVISLNILKGYKIQNSTCDVTKEKCQVYFEELNVMDILEKQNMLSRDSESGYIWVLNICIFLVAEYRFELLISETRTGGDPHAKKRSNRNTKL